MITQPMLAYNGPLPPLDQLPYPLLCTPKIDGIRALKIDGRLVSRTFKLIQNDYIRNTVERACVPDGFDGELCCPGGFQPTTSAVMSRSGTPAFVWCVFDYVSTSLTTPYVHRMKDLNMWCKLNISTNTLNGNVGFINPVLPDFVTDEGELLMFEQICLERGYEGVMIRVQNGPYKCGRSTLAEGWLLKLKRFVNSEAVVRDTEELYLNKNPSHVNDLGYAERSSARSGCVSAEVLGSMLVEDVNTHLIFSIGSGFTYEQRSTLWSVRSTLIGKVIKYKYQPSGMKDLPRFPIFLSFRDDKPEKNKTYFVFL